MLSSEQKKTPLLTSVNSLFLILGVLYFFLAHAGMWRQVHGSQHMRKTVKSPKGPETFLCVKVCTIFMVSFYLQIFWGFFFFLQKGLVQFQLCRVFQRTENAL